MTQFLLLIDITYLIFQSMMAGAKISHNSYDSSSSRVTVGQSLNKSRFQKVPFHLLVAQQEMR